MALAKKCDRCGRLYEHYPTGVKTQYNAIQRKEYSSDGRFVTAQNPLDLCPDCMAEFDKFMTSGGKFDDNVL